jgi:hypothetical protein
LLDKVVLDLFWSSSCLTTDTKAQRVREVAGAYNAVTGTVACL